MLWVAARLYKGAEDEARTRDIQLGRLTLYQLSYFRVCREKEIWWAVMDSNHRRRTPADLQSAPFGHSGNYPCFENRSHTLRVGLYMNNHKKEPMVGLEPTTSWLQISCSTNWATSACFAGAKIRTIFETANFLPIFFSFYTFFWHENTKAGGIFNKTILCFTFENAFLSCFFIINE